MCGIAGVVSGPMIAGARGADLAQRLHHRGPDASGSRLFAHCALGHTRLRIIDLSPLGDQPMANEDESVWAVFNGEIYNFTELRTALAADGHQFRSHTDTEVLVHLYEKHGEDMAHHLRGMFAFAIWDERRQRLLLCRDRLGIKPLYYRVDSDGLSFASEVQALVRPGDPIDLEAVSSFLRLGWVAGPQTIRSGISELLPGHVLVWEGGRAAQRPYWSLPAARPDGHAPDDGRLGEVLADAMRRHLVADVPVGLFLSAGVDSVVVARVASRIAPDLRTYTVAFDAAQDESVDAAGLARQLGLDHTVVPVGHDEAQASVGRFITSMDQPTVDGLNSWIISKAVREAGLVVALSGLGGDELFCGYSTFRHVPRLARAGQLARPLRPILTAADGAFTRSDGGAHSRSRRALAGLAEGSWGAAYAAVRGLFSPGELARVWPAARELGTEPVSARAPVDGQGPEAVVGELELTNYLPFQLLRDTDCMSMAHALEVRVPLLDDVVVEMARRGQGSATRSWDKRRLVAAVDPALAHLAARPKRTFTLPIDDWMRGGLRPLTEDAIAGLGQSELGFDRRELTQVWCGYLGGRVGWRPVWALAVLGMWLAEHETSSTPRQVSLPVPVP